MVYFLGVKLSLNFHSPQCLQKRKGRNRVHDFQILYQTAFFIQESKNTLDGIVFEQFNENRANKLSMCVHDV